MQLFDVYPAGAVGGSCFITKDYTVGDGRKVISLDVRLDNLPATGLLCVSQEAVRQMNVILGWDADEQGHERRKALTARVAELEAENESMRAAFAALVAATPPAPIVTEPVEDVVKVAAVIPVTEQGVEEGAEQREVVKKTAAKKAPAKKRAAAKK